MSGCVLESAEGAGERESLYSMLRESGSRSNPLITQFCKFHGVPHVVEVPSDLSARKSFDIPKEAFEPIKYVEKRYCPDCASYHIGGCSSPGRAEALGTEQWGNKAVNL